MEKSPAAQRLRRHRSRRILFPVAATGRGSAYREPEAQEGQAAQPVRKAAGIFRIDEPAWTAKGGVGTGIADRVEIESGHRQVAQKRIKRPGAWRLIDKVGAMANMIAARLNGGWDSYWGRVAA